MAQGNQPQKRDLAAKAFMRTYAALHNAIAQPDVPNWFAVQLYSDTIITRETRDAVQTSPTPIQQASLLLQGVESSIKTDYTRLWTVTKLLKKQPVLKPIAKKLLQRYRKFVNVLCAIISFSDVVAYIL